VVVDEAGGAQAGACGPGEGGEAQGAAAPQGEGGAADTAAGEEGAAGGPHGAGLSGWITLPSSGQEYEARLLLVLHVEMSTSGGAPAELGCRGQSWSEVIRLLCPQKRMVKTV